MKQGNYKTLILKLLGTALGLVVMLFGASVLTHNFMTEKTLHSSNGGSYSSAMVSPERIFVPVNEEFVVALEDEFKVITEDGKQIVDQTLTNAELALNGIKVVHIRKMIRSKSDMVANLSEAIQEIAEKTIIPAEMRETIIADMALQLKKNELMLQELEVRILSFSYKFILPASKYNRGSECNEEAIIEKYDGDCTDANGRKNHRDSRKAFSWI